MVTTLQHAPGLEVMELWTHFRVHAIARQPVEHANFLGLARLRYPSMMGVGCQSKNELAHLPWRRRRSHTRMACCALLPPEVVLDAVFLAMASRWNLHSPCIRQAPVSAILGGGGVEGPSV